MALVETGLWGICPVGYSGSGGLPGLSARSLSLPSRVWSFWRRLLQGDCLPCGFFPCDVRGLQVATYLPAVTSW